MCKKIPVVLIHHLGNLDDLIQSGFWVIPKITFANSCKPIQDVIIRNFQSGKCGKRKKIQKIQYFENEELSFGKI